MTPNAAMLPAALVFSPAFCWPATFTVGWDLPVELAAAPSLVAEALLRVVGFEALAPRVADGGADVAAPAEEAPAKKSAVVAAPLRSVVKTSPVSTAAAAVVSAPKKSSSVPVGRETLVGM